jgi:RNase P/RNase MRP subunit POP5
MREDQRYIAYEILSARPVHIDVQSAISKHMHATLGMFDGAVAGLMPVTYDRASQKGIIKVSNVMVTKTKIALLLAGKDVFHEAACCWILHVSGTLKTLMTKAPQRQKITFKKASKNEGG